MYVINVTYDDQPNARLSASLEWFSSSTSTDFYFFRVEVDCRVKWEILRVIAYRVIQTLWLSSRSPPCSLQVFNEVPLGRTCRSGLWPYPRYISPSLAPEWIGVRVRKGSMQILSRYTDLEKIGRASGRERVLRLV